MFETPLYRLADVLSSDFPGVVAALMAGCWAVACLLTFSGLEHICIECPGRRWVRKALLG